MIFWLNLGMETEILKLITVIGSVGITAMIERGMSRRMLFYRYRLYLLYLKSKWRHKYTYNVRHGDLVCSVYIDVSNKLSLSIAFVAYAQ